MTTVENRRFGPYMRRVYDTQLRIIICNNGLKSVATIFVEPTTLLTHRSIWD